MPKFFEMIRVFTSLTALAIAFPAQALEEQTVEGAQRFLSMVLPQAGYMPASARTGVVYAKEAAPSARIELRGRARVTNAAILSRCKSKLEFDASDLRFFMMDRGQSQEVSVLSIANNSTPYGQAPEGFHWGKDIVAATQTGNTIDLKFLHAKNIASIYLGDEAMAKRVIYAINFLRIECDPASDTGF